MEEALIAIVVLVVGLTIAAISNGTKDKMRRAHKAHAPNEVQKLSFSFDEKTLRKSSS